MMSAVRESMKAAGSKARAGNFRAGMLSSSNGTQRNNVMTPPVMKNTLSDSKNVSDDNVDGVVAKKSHSIKAWKYAARMVRVKK